MNAKVESSGSHLDLVKWVVVFALIIAAVVGNSFYAELSLLYRVPALLVVALVTAFIAAQTSRGGATVSLLKESIVEVRKVVWPTPQETHQTTLIVIVVVVVMAMILWGLDSLLGWIASLILG